MAWTVFGAIEFNPLWRKQEEDDVLKIVLPIALLGMTFAFWSFPIWFTANFSVSLQNQMQDSDLSINPTFFDQQLSNFLISTIIGLFISVIMVFIILKSNSNFKELKITDEWKNIEAKVFDLLSLSHDGDENQQGKYRLYLFGDLFFVLLSGYIAGIYYSLILYIPFYLTYIFMIFILFNFFSIPISFTLSMLISWILTYWWLIRRKLFTEENPSFHLDPSIDYDLSNRRAEIMVSNEPPIICQGCRSYISASSTICKICGDKILVD